jgi:ectoine hydroxylase-related dioxygenase (phytanoyl-CoA dioxygenase family)
MNFDPTPHIERIDRDGYSVIEDFLSPSVLAEVRRVLGFYLGSHEGRNSFEGFKTERVYTLVARGRVFWEIVLDPRITALCDHYLMLNSLLTASQAIQINPGEAAQAFHFDDSFYHLPRPRRMISLSTIVAIDPFTEANGATQVIPGSQHWSEKQISSAFGFGSARAVENQDELATQSIAATLPAGGCLVFSGTVVHRGGRNRSMRPRCAFSNQYCQPWARQQENFMLAVPPEVVRAMPMRLQQMLGYSIHPPFIGQLSASHPLKSLEADYRNPIAEQARAAGAQLPE